MRASSLFLICALVLTGSAPQSSRAGGISGQLIHYPETLSKSCRNGRARIYDECSDQLRLFAEASTRANAEHKVLLAVYGSEWCIWCHAFDAYVRGGKDTFTYTYGSPQEPDARHTSTLYERAPSDVSTEADALGRFVADNFVILHVESDHAPNGASVLEQTGAAAHHISGIPFVFTVSADGKFAAAMDDTVVEIRRNGDDWYRGYDRGKLIAQLSSMRDAARR